MKTVNLNIFSRNTERQALRPKKTLGKKLNAIATTMNHNSKYNHTNIPKILRFLGCLAWATPLYHAYREAKNSLFPERYFEFLRQTLASNQPEQLSVRVNLLLGFSKLLQEADLSKLSADQAKDDIDSIEIKFNSLVALYKAHLANEQDKAHSPQLAEAYLQALDSFQDYMDFVDLMASEAGKSGLLQFKKEGGQ